MNSQSYQRPSLLIHSAAHPLLNTISAELANTWDDISRKQRHHHFNWSQHKYANLLHLHKRTYEQIGRAMQVCLRER